MIENRGKYFKNTSSFPLPKIPLVDSPKPANVDQMWTMFSVNITIKVNHVISTENWTYMQTLRKRFWHCRAGEDSKRLQALSEDEITELLTLQKYKAIDLHETTTWWTTKKVLREENLLKTA